MGIRYIILFFLVSIAFVPLIWRIVKCIVPRFNKVQYQEYKNASDLLVQIGASSLILAISVLSESFPLSFILLIFYILLGWVIIRFIQAAMQIGTFFDKDSAKLSDGYTLKEYLLDSDKKEGLKWQISFVKLSILYYVVWIFICILKCI